MSEGDEQSAYQEYKTEEDDFSFELIADRLNIPQDNWESRPVRQFVELYRRTLQLQHDLSRAVYDYQASPEERAQREALTEGMEPTLSERYSRAEILGRVMGAVMEEGFNGKHFSENYLTAKLNVAINPYGLQVTPRRRPGDSDSEAEKRSLNMPPNPSLKAEEQS